nr:PREDICTED: sal-like protein 2 [Anolis carolinensis]|eukprot:XP_008118619.1 PREDICTED: sal-like protein 2 [Anolis carolinensis]
MPGVSGGQVKLQDFLGRDIPAQLVGVGPLSFWNQYTAFLSGGLPTKPAHMGSSPSPSSSSAASPSSSSSASNLVTQSLFGSGSTSVKTGSSEVKEKPPVGSLLLLPPPPPPPAPPPEVVPESQGKGEQ